MTLTADDPLTKHLACFGLAAFRPGQRAVIETVLSGKDCLCVMPTGGGKSLCYQLPAIARDGVTLVISPLIALMKDQVDGLTARGLPATFINSTLSPDEQSARLSAMAAGEYKLVYVVPERFRSSRFVEAARQSRVRLLAVDEAHCVSEWGHDFRPDYARLGSFRKKLGDPPTIALTATATDSVRRDIVELLNLREPEVFITGFARPNLHYGVSVCAADRDKDQRLFAFLKQHPGSGIVYASTRKRCEDLAERIAAESGRSTVVYHAGLQPQERRAAQDAFMESKREIAVATLAFGMGIDKSNVRFVVHYNLPGSLEAYYQEAGRAGRDGQPASCLLLFGGGDRNIHEFFIESSYPDRSVVRQVYDYLRGLDQSPIEMTQQEVKEALGLQISGEGVGACEKLLESAGALERLESSENTAAVRLSSDVPTLVELLPPQAKIKRRVMRAVENFVGPRRHEWCYVQPRELLRELPELDSADFSRHMRELTSLSAFDYVPPFRGRAIHIRDRTIPFQRIEIDFETLEKQKAAEYERLEHVLRFARDHRCRQLRILEYFGQEDGDPCGNCDNCQPRAAAPGAHGRAREVDDKVLETVRMVLSGVARASQRRVGCGKQLIAKMLCGSSDKAVIRNRLDQLTTFGLLNHLKQAEVAQLMDAMLAAGLLEQNEIEPFRPIVQFTKRGLEIMAGRVDEPLSLSVSDTLWRKIGGSTRAKPAAVKSAEVKSAAVKPAIANPANSKSEAAALKVETPKTPEAGAAAATGISPDREPQDTHAPGEADSPREPEAKQPAAAIGVPAALQPSHYWTWRLLEAGFSPAECAAARGLEEEVVLDHALRAADGGLAIDALWFFSAEQIATIRGVVGSVPPERIRPLLGKLPRGTRYEHVLLVLKSR